MGRLTRELVQGLFDYGELDAFVEALDPDVVWTGIGGEICRNREEVRGVFEEALARGVRARPEVVAEAGDRVVVDPHVEPPPPNAPFLHQVFTLEEDRIVRMEDYPDRTSALRAVGLS